MNSTSKGLLRVILGLTTVEKQLSNKDLVNDIRGHIDAFKDIENDINQLELSTALQEKHKAFK